MFLVPLLGKSLVNQCFARKNQCFWYLLVSHGVLEDRESGGQGGGEAPETRPVLSLVLLNVFDGFYSVF